MIGVYFVTLFGSASAKVARAEDQIECLDSQIGTFVASKHYDVRQNLAFAPGRMTLACHFLSEMPVKLPVVLGEILHDLRCALDSLIYDLTCIERHPFPSTEFPVFDDDSLFFAVRSKGAHKGDSVLTSGRFSFAESSFGRVQLSTTFSLFEFRYHNEPNASAVIGLMLALYIIDKHRTLFILRIHSGSNAMRVLRDVELIEARMPFGEVKDGAQLAEWIRRGSRIGKWIWSSGLSFG